MKNLLHQDQIDQLKREMNKIYCSQHPTRHISDISLKKNAQQKKGCVECKNKNKLEDPIDYQTAIDQIIEAQNDLREYLDKKLHLQIEKTLPEMQQRLIQYIENAKSYLIQQRTVLQNKINLDKIQGLYKSVMANCRENHFDELYDFTIQWFEKSNEYGIQRSEYYEKIKIEQDQLLLEQIEKIKSSIGLVFDELNSFSKVFNIMPRQPNIVPDPPQPLINPVPPIKIQQQKPEINIGQLKQINFNQKKQKIELLVTFTMKFQTTEDLTITKILLPQLNEFDEEVYFNLNLNQGPNQKIIFKQIDQNDDMKWFQLKTHLKILKNVQYTLRLQKIDINFQVYFYQFQEMIKLDHFSILDAQLGVNKCLILRGFEYFLGHG